ncbi:SDR family NAD(P)-dependent oxidoreductase [Myroides odoratimimus]|uniref:SDR family NAD(P)-dependent oxidoreductase n=1 Tax=Myroides odoratimimus TaxID=76832 RepID=UPI0009B829A6|nr:SDR family NAD(P)-dependent oxidoreductase [Myroides odoratimimus]
MVKIFITGSSDGLGLLAAKKLIEDGHQVVLHARNEELKNRKKNPTKFIDTLRNGLIQKIEEDDSK